MSRNYAKEREWQKNKYDEIRAKIDKDLGKQLREQLKNEGKSMSSWVSDNAKKYLEKK